MLMVNCKQCSLNTTHSSGVYMSFVLSGMSWKSSPNHLYAKECVPLEQTNPTIGEMPIGEKGTSTSGGTRQGTSASTGSSLVSIE